jgi:cysteine desulfurase
MKHIYLDYAATTPVHPDVMKTMLPYFNDTYGNPSAIHHLGQESRAAIEGARSSVSKLIGARDDEIIFTGSGTEADNFAIKGIAFAKREKGDHIITSTIEHHAVLETCDFLEKQGFSVTYVQVDQNGLVDPDDIKKAITNKTIIVSMMHANNEIGTIEPIYEIGKIAREADICFHTDAVQTTGHIPIDVDKMNVDLLSISAHKLYGPKGVGALYIRKGTRMTPFIHGGRQEMGKRASTENVPGIVGLGKAAQIALQEMAGEATRITALRQRLIEGIQGNIEDTLLNGHPTIRLPNNVNIIVDFVDGEAMLLLLDQKGICVSTGSACSSADLGASHVLTALGLSAYQAHGSLRFSLGKWTTEEDIDYVLEVFPQIVTRLRAMSPLAKKSK